MANTPEKVKEKIDQTNANPKVVVNSEDSEMRIGVHCNTTEVLTLGHHELSSKPPHSTPHFIKDLAEDGIAGKLTRCFHQYIDSYISSYKAGKKPTLTFSFHHITGGSKKQPVSNQRAYIITRVNDNDPSSLKELSSKIIDECLEMLNIPRTSNAPAEKIIPWEVVIKNYLPQTNSTAANESAAAAPTSSKIKLK